MAYKNYVKEAPATPFYVNFEPISELKEEEGADTLIIHLPGFKKEQLRVQVNNAGILTVNGEKPENAEGTRKRRFIKETAVPEGCDVNGIRAKFDTGKLHITMPKKIMTPPHPVVEQKVQHEEPAQMPSTPPKPEDAPMAKAETVEPADQRRDHPSDGNGKIGRVKDQMAGLGDNVMTRLQGRKNKVAIAFGVAMVAMVVFGAFVAYKYGSSPTSYMEE